VGRRQFLGYLESGVSAADDHNGSHGNVARTPVARAVHLDDVRREVRGERRQIRALERTRRNHNLVGLETPSSKVEDEAAVCGCDRLDRAVQPNWQSEGRCVAFEIVDDLLATGISIRVARELETRKPVVPTRREEHD